MLTPSAVANVKPRVKPYKLADERGLYLRVGTSRERWWRFDYRRPGTHKRNTLSLGTYPDVSLKHAREKRDALRKLLANGVDPAMKRRAEAEANADTFEAVAREWYARHAATWAASHASKVLNRLERNVFPWIGGKPIAELTAPDVRALCYAVSRRVEQLKLRTASCSTAGRYSVTPSRQVV